MNETISPFVPILPPKDGCVERELDGIHYMHPIDENLESYKKLYEDGYIPKEVYRKLVSRDDIKKLCVIELSDACQKMIFLGQDIELSDDTTEHFEFKDQDQSNIKQLWDAIKDGATAYPYQSDTGSCKVYPAADIVKIYVTMSTTITSNITYYHQLKDYVNSLETADEVEAVTWGQELTGEYLEHYNAMMAEANTQMRNIMSNFGAAQ